MFVSAAETMDTKPAKNTTVTAPYTEWSKK